MKVQVTCGKCGAFNDLDDAACWKCKREIPEEVRQAAVEQAKQAAAEKQQFETLSRGEQDRWLVDKARERGDWKQVPPEVLERASSRILLTTSYQLASREIQSEIALVTAQVAVGIGVRRSFFASSTGLTGGRIGAAEEFIQEAQNAALSELRTKALMLGADAVIAVSLPFQVIEGGAIFVSGTGTAVTVRR